MKAPYLSNISKRSPCFLALAIFISVNLVTLTGSSSAVFAQTNNIQDTLKRLETQLQTLERSVYRNSPPPKNSMDKPSLAVSKAPPPAVSQLQLKSSELEEQIRGITGKVEEIGFRMTQIKDRLDRLVADVDFRLRTLETSYIQPKPEISGEMEQQNIISILPNSIGFIEKNDKRSAVLNMDKQIDLANEKTLS